MKKIRLSFVLVVLFFVSVGLGAQNLTVDYMEGTVESKNASGAWKLLDMGSTLAPDAQVRLAKGALAELLGPSGRLHLSKEGTYSLAQLIAKGKSAPSTSLMTMTSDQVGKLLGTKASSTVPVSNAGVRGDKKDGADIQWATDDPATPASSPLASITALVEAKDWSGAVKAADAALAQKPLDPQPFRLAKARALAGWGRSGAALVVLQKANIQPAEELYLEGSLLLATLALDVQDYDLVVATTAESLKRITAPEPAQTLTLAQALAYRGLGKEAQATTGLKSVIALGASTPAGKEASRLLP